jgi:hypothetical protein
MEMPLKALTENHGLPATTTNNYTTINKRQSSFAWILFPDKMHANTNQHP